MFPAVQELNFEQVSTCSTKLVLLLFSSVCCKGCFRGTAWSLLLSEVNVGGARFKLLHPGSLRHTVRLGGMELFRNSRHLSDMKRVNAVSNYHKFLYLWWLSFHPGGSRHRGGGAAPTSWLPFCITQSLAMDPRLPPTSATPFLSNAVSLLQNHFVLEPPFPVPCALHPPRSLPFEGALCPTCSI